MDDRVTQYLDAAVANAPAPVDLASSTAPGETRRKRWLRPWMGGALLLLIPGLLSGSREQAREAEPARAVESPSEDVPLNEWIRIAGVAPLPQADAEPLQPQWSIRVAETEDASGAQELLGGNVRGLSLGGLPIGLGRLFDVFEATGSQMQLAAAGGQMRLAGGQLPPWMWADASATLDAPRAQSVRVTLPPMLDGQARMSGLDAWVEGISYRDPTGVGLPLRRAGGLMEYRLSEHFQVRDFATRDGAPYLRVDLDLVAGLERLRRQLGPVEIISGYRHPSYNARADVGGARYSRHQSGQAADVYSVSRTSTEIALAAVQTMGCGIGLGLGENTVHIDVRGYLKTWTYPGAPLSDAAFAQWIHSLCGDSAPRTPSLPRRLTNEEWLALVADGTEDEAETIHTSERAVELTVEAPIEAPPARRRSIETLVQRDLASVAREGFARDGVGVVVVDLRDGAQPEGDALRRRARYVRASLPEVLRMERVDRLLRWVEGQPEGTFFVYALRQPDGAVQSGVASTASLAAGSRPAPVRVPVEPVAPSAPPSPSPAQERPAEVLPPALSPASGRWHLLVGSAASMEAVTREVDAYRALLGATDVAVSPHFDGRGETLSYRVSIGPFPTQADAEAMIERVRPAARAEVELVELGF